MNPVCLVSLLNDCVVPFKVLAKEKNVHLEMEIEPSSSPTVNVDAVRYKQIIVNLLSNSVKFTPCGGRIDVRSRVDHDGPEETLITTVSDTGIGILPEQLPELFKPYRQATVNNISENIGSGLGLSIVHMIVKLMNGHINVKSTVGQGTVFTVTIPTKARPHRTDSVQEAVIDISDNETEAFLGRSSCNSQETCSDRGDLPRPPPSPARSQNPDLRAMDTLVNVTPVESSISLEYTPASQPKPVRRVLVVDDSDINRTILTHLLRSLLPDCEIDNADDGDIAISKASEKQYDVIFMDIVMPRVGGFDAAAEIRRFDSNSVIFAATANSVLGNEAEYRMLQQAGMNDALVKPFTKAILKDMIAKHGFIM